MAGINSQIIFDEFQIKYSCEVCRKPFVTEKALKMHENIHTGAKPYTCQVCGKAFNHISNRQRHEKTVHKVIQ